MVLRIGVTQWHWVTQSKHFYDLKNDRQLANLIGENIMSKSLIALVILCVFLVTYGYVGSAQSYNSISDKSISVGDYVFTADLPITRGASGTWMVDKFQEAKQSNAVNEHSTVMNVMYDPKINYDEQDWSGFYVTNWLYHGNSFSDEATDEFYQTSAEVSVAVVNIPQVWKNLMLTQNEILSIAVGKYPSIMNQSEQNITFSDYPAYLVEASDRFSNAARLAVALDNDTIGIISVNIGFADSSFRGRAFDLINKITITKIITNETVDSEKNPVDVLLAALPTESEQDYIISTHLSTSDINNNNNTVTNYKLYWNGSAFYSICPFEGYRNCIIYNAPIALSALPTDVINRFIKNARALSISANDAKVFVPELGRINFSQLDNIA